MDNISNRILGLFFGQLTGDALGARYEFLCSDDAIKKLSKDINNGSLKMKGGGPFNLKKAQYTDDSELALGIWYSILNRKTYDLDHIVKIFYRWYNSEPFDIGISTEKAFGSGKNKDDMKSNAKKNINSLSNGCLMKISPMGAINFLFPGKKFNLEKIAKEICEMTNPNEICIDMTICYLYAIDTAIKTGDPIKTYKKAVEKAKLPITQMILEDSKTRYKPVKLLNSNNMIIEIEPDSSYQGYIGISFASAFYHLLNTDDYTDSMMHMIGMGGDTDTNCCIGGSLYGACYGVKKINHEWIKNILDFTNDKERIKKYIPIDHQEIFFKLLDKLNKLD